RFNPDFNILSVLINPFYILLVSYLILPLSIVTCLIPPLAPLYQLVMAIFQKSVENLANIKFLRVSLGNINIYFKLLYYAMFYFFLRSLYTKKYYLWIVIPVLLLLWYGKGWFQLETKIIFLDMPTGDACLITTPHQKEVIVIDTSDVTKNNEMAKILKNEGVRKIDYLILTHHDSDHAGGAKMLVQDLKTKNLISSYYEEEALAEISAHVRKRYLLRRGDCLSKGGMKLEVLSPGKDYGNPNDNSLVFIISVDGVTLFNMGDASTKVEQQLLNDKINVDFYKVGHHGSITSTSISFLERINYQYAIIMNGYQNKFGFPSPEVVSRFDERLIVTKDEGSIYFKVYRGKIRYINWRRKLIYG
ncbi:MAG: MBL fold metallo-hydrolase, partial [Bacilli bacterium]|nr:MBL fold metallo-hydrolase [Bacilli bacterium]